MSTSVSRLSALGAAWCLSLALAVSASAQTTPSSGQTNNSPPDLTTSASASSPSSTSATTQAKVVKLDPFVVQGYRSSLEEAIDAKRAAQQVMDSINAEQIGQFGEQDVGEAIQRIAGVSLTRNNGEGQFISIRGMDPEFTSVQIDGRSTFVTSDQSDPGRAVLLAGFDADLYQQIQVIKSPTAADDAGGLGGIVKLKTPDPLTLGRLHYRVEANMMDAQLRDRKEPGFKAFFSDTFLHNRLGVLLNATYQERDRRLDKFQTGTKVWEAAKSSDPNLNGGFFPQRIRQEARKGIILRFNLNGKIQFQVTPDLQLYANTVLVRERRHEYRSRIQIEFSKGSFITGTIDPTTKTLTSAEFTKQQSNYNDFTRDTHVPVTGVTGGFIWKHGLWQVKGWASETYSEENFDEYQAKAQIKKDGVGGYNLASDPRTPVLYTASTSLAPDKIALSGLTDNKRIISEGVNEAHLDATRWLRHAGILTAIQAGLRDAQTKFKRRQGGPPGADINGLTFADGISPFVLDGSGGSFGFGQNGGDLLTTWPEVNAKAMFLKYAPGGPVVFSDSSHYTITESDEAGYLMGDFQSKLGKAVLKGNLGVRLTHTRYRGNGRVTITTLNETYVLDNQPALSADYQDPLPALNFTIQPHYGSNVLVRGAVTRAMSRPTVSEINPSIQIDTVNAAISEGNPDLKPFRAWQYDLGVEYYFGQKNRGLFSVAGFDKAVQNFIVPHITVENQAYPDQGVAAQDYTVSTYINGEKATVRGLEVNLQSPFTFLPGFLKNFGGMANYTLVDSSFTDQNGNTFTFPGASRNTYNLVLYYQHQGFSGRLAYNYRSTYLVTPSSQADGGNALYNQGGGRLDLSLRYAFERGPLKGIRLSFDALNLTRTEQYQYYDIAQRYSDFTFEGRIFRFSVAYAY